MATNFRVKIGEIGLLTLAFENGLEYRDTNFKRFNGDDGYIVCKFGEPAAEFTYWAIGVHLLVDEQFSYTFDWRRQC